MTERTGPGEQAANGGHRIASTNSFVVSLIGALLMDGWVFALLS